MNDKDKVLNFIKHQELAVISTIGMDGKPSAAVIGFGETEDFELVFGTYNDSRKYANLMKNSDVAFVIGWDENITVQYEGIAEELNESNSTKYKGYYFSKNPKSKEYESDPKERYFKVKPKWIRYTELNKDPWFIIELKF